MEKKCSKREISVDIWFYFVVDFLQFTVIDGFITSFSLNEKYLDSHPLNRMELVC